MVVFVLHSQEKLKGFVFLTNSSGGTQMTAMEYPFLGKFKNTEETHGHQSAKRGLPTSIAFQVSGENLMIEEVVSEQPGTNLDVHLGVKGKHQTAPLPTGARSIPIPNDGKHYFVATKAENNTSRNYCKLWLEGRTTGGSRPVTPSSSIPSGPKFVRVEAHYGQHTDEAIRVYGSGEVDHRIPVGREGTSLDVSSGSLTLILPKPKGDDSARHAAPTTMPCAPKMDISFGLVQQGKAVVSAALPPGHSNRIEMTVSYASAKGNGHCELELDPSKSHQLFVTLYNVDGLTAMSSQSITVPALQQTVSKPVEFRVEEHGTQGRTLVANSPGATISVEHSGTFNGIPGVRLQAGQSCSVDVHQVDGGHAKVSLQDHSDDVAWLQQCADALKRYGQDNRQLANALKHLKPAPAPQSNGDTILKHFDKLLSELEGHGEQQGSTLSAVISGEQLTNIQCHGGSVTAKIGQDAPCLLATGSAVPLTDGASVTLTTQRDGKQQGSFVLQRKAAKQAADDGALKELTDFVKGLSNALRPGRGKLPEIRGGLQTMNVPPSNAPADHVVTTLLDVLEGLTANTGDTEHIASITSAASSLPVGASFDEHPPMPLSASPLTIPASVKSIKVSTMGPPPASGGCTIVPAVNNVYQRTGGDIPSLRSGWAAIVAQTQEDNDLLNMLHKLLDTAAANASQPRSTGQRELNFAFSLADGQLHSVSCVPYTVVSSVDGLPPSTLGVTDTIPATGRFSPGASHTVTLTAVDRNGETVGKTTVTIPSSGFEGLSHGQALDSLEVDVGRGDSGKTRLTAKVSEEFKLACEVQGQRVTMGSHGCTLDLDPGQPHRCTFIATSNSSNSVVFRLPVVIPRMALPLMNLSVDTRELYIAPTDGVMCTIAENGGRDEIASRCLIQPDVPHTFSVKQYVQGPTSSQMVGEHKLKLPPLADAESIRDLVTILTEGEGAPWSKLTFRLMKLHGRTPSEVIRDLIQLLVARLIDQDSAEKLSAHCDRVIDTIQTIKSTTYSGGRAPAGQTLFFRLKGEHQ